MTIDMMEQQVADLNRQAVRLLSVGEYSNALDLFLQVSRLIDSAFAAYFEESKPLNTASTSTPVSGLDAVHYGLRAEEQQSKNYVMEGLVDEFPHDMSCCGPFNYFPSCECTSVTIPKLTDERFHIYNNAIIFYPEIDDEDTELPEMEDDSVTSVETDDDDTASSVEMDDDATVLLADEKCVDFTFYSAVVTFNMALCYHSAGNASGSRSLLEKATNLYNTCHQIMDDLILYCGGTHLLLATCLNNCALIYYDLDDARFKAQFQEMTKLVQSSSALMKLSGQCKFLLNITLSPTTLQTAPSA